MYENRGILYIIPMRVIQGVPINESKNASGILLMLGGRPPASPLTYINMLVK